MELWASAPLFQTAGEGRNGDFGLYRVVTWHSPNELAMRCRLAWHNNR